MRSLTVMQRPEHNQKRTELRLALVATGVVLALALIGFWTVSASAQGAATATPTATGCPTATPTSGSGAAAPCVEIGEYDIYFKPNQITIPADTPVRIVLTNHGVTMHNFSITDHGNAGKKNLNISVNTDPGKMSETTINAPEGTYYFFCNVPGHEAAGMRGLLVVKKDAKVATAEATVTPPAG